MTDAETVIRVNVRPAWHQRTRLPLDSPELHARMEAQAWLALRQTEAAVTIEVVAIAADRWHSVRLERPVATVRTGVARSALPAWV